MTKLLVAVAVVAGGFAMTTPAYGISYTITTTSDVVANDGACSLREAIFAANFNAQAHTGGGECPAGQSTLDVITLDAATYPLALSGVDNDGLVGDLDLRGLGGPLTITGAGSEQTFIDGADVDRVFHITSGTHVVTFEGLTIEDGFSATDSCEGGGIRNVGKLTLNDVVVTGNHARSGGGIHTGSGGELTMNDSSVTSNTANYSGAGVVQSNGGTVNITRSAVSGNSQIGGLSACAGSSQGMGGVMNDGVMTIDESTIELNTSVGSMGGGGVYNSSSEGDLTITRSTIRGNQATGSGGGIKNENDGSVTVVNSTISANGAGTSGAAIYGAQGEIELESVTIANNLAGPGVDGIDADDPTGTYTAQNTIVADGCDGPGVVNSLGYNIDDGTTCDFDEITDQSSTDPQLEPLFTNGGPTQTHALDAGSPAIDEGDCDDLTTDQRGVLRPQGNACDIGAFETTPPSVAITEPQEDAHTSADYMDLCDFGNDVCGTATANVADVALVEVQIQRASDNRFWDGDSFETTAPANWLDATGTTSWRYLFAPPGDDVYELSARATDEDGYVSAEAVREFTIDNTAPAAPDIDSASISKRRNKATFTFSGEPGGSFECRRDNKPFVACTSPVTYTRLKDGKHTFTVRQIDDAGNVGATATMTFRV